MKRTYQQILDDAVRKAVPDTMDLSRRIRGQISGKPDTQAWFGLAHPALSILLLLVILTLVTGVVYAVGRTLGYIPGVGFVDGPPRQLTAPVSVEREGIVLTVKQGFLTDESTVLTYWLENVSRELLSQEEAQSGCHELPYLILPDGRILQSVEFSGNFNEFRAAFPPIPPEYDQASFELPCVPYTLPGLAPEDWRISLNFGEADPTLVSVPVQEMELQQQEKQSTNPSAPVRLTKSLLVGSQYVLLGEIQPPVTGDWVEVDDIRVLDAAGEEIATQFPSLYDLPDFDWGVQFAAPVQLPLTLEVDWVELRLLPDAAVSFQFNAGEDPQPGQEWIIEQEIEIGGYSMILSRVQANSRGGYTFFFRNAQKVRGVTVQLSERGERGGGGGGGGGSSAPGSGGFSAGFSADSLAVGDVEVTISNLLLEVSSATWKNTWDAEGLSGSEIDSGDDPSEVCIAETEWTQLLESGAISSLPAESQFLTAISEGGMLPAIYLADSSGTLIEEYASGAWSALSPDGNNIAYSDGSGIHVRDRLAGSTVDFNRDGFRMIWSPDSSQMMFASAGYLYLSDPQGTNQRMIETEPSQVVIPVGWLPDGSRIVYSYLSGGGFQLVLLDLETGMSEKMSLVHNKDGFGAVSPDGEWIVYLDQDSELEVPGIYISRLDGTDRRLVAELSRGGVAIPVVWSPDSSWLSVSVYAEDGQMRSFLVDPFNCQVAKSPVTGQVTGWIRR